jgi:hypothetical protein
MIDILELSFLPSEFIKVSALLLILFGVFLLAYFSLLRGL